MKKIMVVLNKQTGEVHVETEGFHGASCQDATEQLERLLGVDRSQEELKPEYYHERQHVMVDGGLLCG